MYRRHGPRPHSSVFEPATPIEEFDEIRRFVLVNSAYIPKYTGSRFFRHSDDFFEDTTSKVTIFGSNIKIGDSLNVELTGLTRIN